MSPLIPRSEPVSVEPGAANVRSNVRVDVHVSEGHYWRQIAPVFAALPAGQQGRVWCHPRVADLIRRDISGSKVAVGVPGQPPRPVLVAACSDLAAVERVGVPIALLEHGAGQTYQDHAGPCYAGGSDRDAVSLFLCPSERVADLNRQRYPSARAVAVGAPHLDRWHAQVSQELVRPDGRPTVAFAFHWNCGVNPETRWAWPHYEAEIRRLAADRDNLPFRILGHGHPRFWRWFADRWEDMRVDMAPDFAQVFDEADVLVGDNTSLLWEFASLGRPIVLLDAPWYRRDVEHGLRFWEFADAGVRCQLPAELLPAITTALAGDFEHAGVREEAVAAVYAYRDGQAAQRAAAAVVEWTESMEAIMTNPKAPQRTHVMRGAPMAAATLPERRLRRLGATDEDLARARGELAGLGDEERDAAIARINAMTDSEIRQALADDRADNAPPVDEAASHPDAPDEDAKPEAEPVDPADVPTGTVQEVLAWAAGDQARARAALDAEQARSSPRRTLVAALEAILGG